MAPSIRLATLILSLLIALSPIATASAEQSQDMVWNPQAFALPTVDAPSGPGVSALSRTGTATPTVQTPIPTETAGDTTPKKSGVCLDTLSLTRSQRCLFCGIGCEH